MGRIILFDKIFASKNKVLRYKIVVHPFLRQYETEFENMVYYILNHKNNFSNHKKGLHIKFIPIKFESCDFEIHLAIPSTIKEKCNTYTMSCVNCLGGDKIFINSDRWLYGSSKSKLDLFKYRHYLIYHELFHLLDQTHTTYTKGKPCPIMVQQTLGIGDAIPNYYPLPEENDKIVKDYFRYVKNTGHHVKSFTRCESYSSVDTTFLIYSLGLLLMIAAIVAALISSSGSNAK